jgi:glycosyltransferase involved in cell wall biosynthesis
VQVIFLSNQLFDYPLKTNKWQVATRMAKRGHQVLFIDPPIRFRKFLKQVFQRRWSLGRILTFTHHPQENLIVYTPVGCLPKKLSALSRRLHIRNIKGIENSAKRILWVYHVEMEGLKDYIAAIPHELLIYDCVDNYPAFPRYHGKSKLKNWIIKREEWLARKANLIFTSAPGLQTKLSKFNKNTFYVGNAGDYFRFAEPTVFTHPSGVGDIGLSDIQRPIIGFTGAIDGYKVNLPLLVKIAKTYPNYSLVLIGPRGVADDEPNLAELESLSNVRFLGPKPYKDLPRYFSCFDAYIIPYNLNDYTLGGCFPVKFFDALAAGLPTVVTNLPCYWEFSRACYIAEDDSDFVRLIKTAVEENSDVKILERQEVAKNNSWDKKVARMLSIINEAI